MSETETKTETAEAVKPVTPAEFVAGWNAVHNGTAVYTERSNGEDANLKVEIGATPPKTKRGVAALFGMKVNAVANREAQARKGLEKAKQDHEKVLPKFNTKRGRSIDWAEVAETAAVETQAEEIAAE